MKIQIENIGKDQEEQITIACYEVRKEISEIIQFIRTRDLTLPAYQDGEIHYISLPDVYYIETVDNKVFLYLDNKIYESKNRLYELEALCNKGTFYRCSKSVILNLMKIESIAPALHSRFIANLHNGEQLIISRKYANGLKKRLQGG